jgi:hypothetical protein
VNFTHWITALRDFEFLSSFRITMLVSHLEQLQEMVGYAGYIEVDSQLWLEENTTGYDHDVAAQLAGVLISFWQAHEKSGESAQAISAVCGHFVYFVREISPNFLIVRFARNEKLPAVRQQMAAIFDLVEPAEIPLCPGSLSR